MVGLLELPMYLLGMPCPCACQGHAVARALQASTGLHGAVGCQNSAPQSAVECLFHAPHQFSKRSTAE